MRDHLILSPCKVGVWLEPESRIQGWHLAPNLCVSPCPHLPSAGPFQCSFLFISPSASGLCVLVLRFPLTATSPSLTFLLLLPSSLTDSFCFLLSLLLFLSLHLLFPHLLPLLSLYFCPGCHCSRLLSEATPSPS